MLVLGELSVLGSEGDISAEAAASKHAGATDLGLGLGDTNGPLAILLGSAHSHPVLGVILEATSSEHVGSLSSVQVTAIPVIGHFGICCGSATFRVILVVRKFMLMNLVLKFLLTNLVRKFLLTNLMVFNVILGALKFCSFLTHFAM